MKFNENFYNHFWCRWGSFSCVKKAKLDDVYTKLLLRLLFTFIMCVMLHAFSFLFYPPTPSFRLLMPSHQCWKTTFRDEKNRAWHMKGNFFNKISSSSAESLLISLTPLKLLGKRKHGKKLLVLIQIQSDLIFSKRRNIYFPFYGEEKKRWKKFFHIEGFQFVELRGLLMEYSQ